MERSVYLHLLQRWWWTLLLAAWVAGLVGYLAASQIQPSYEAQARLLVGPVNTDINTVRAAESLSQTYAELASTEPQLRRVIERLGLDLEPRDLSRSVSVVANGTTRFLNVRVTNSDPEMTATLANAVAEELVELTSTTIRRPEGELTLVDPAQVPTISTGPNVSVITFLAGSAGLLIAAALVAALEFFSHNVKNREDLATLTQSAVLGEINVNHGYRGSPIQPLVVEAQPESRTALGYQMVASRMPIGDRDDDDGVRRILIVGSQSGERTGEFAANLAAVIARSGRSVTLVDADHIDAQATSMFVPDGRVGLSELLELSREVISTTDILDVVRIRRAPGIEFIPAGNRDVPTVNEDAAEALLDTLAGRSDVVLVAGASIDRSASALTWAKLTEGVVVVARADSTRVQSLTGAIESLRMVDANLIGAVLLERQRGGGRRRRPRRTGSAPAIEDLQLKAKPIEPMQASASSKPARVRESGKGAERRAVGDKGAG